MAQSGASGPQVGGASPSRAVILVEETSVGPRDSLSRALYSAIVTLTLGVLGSTVLPIPYAFSKIGVLPGCLTMAVVAFVNNRTCVMLVRAAAMTGRVAYEDLAEWAGGKRARVVTQVSLILLLYGTLCGGLAFLSDVAQMMMLKGLPPAASPAKPPSGNHLAALHAADPGAGTRALLRAAVAESSGLLAWLQGLWARLLPVLQSDGRPLMLVVVATILYPLCLQRHIRQFEKAATVGVVVVVALVVIIIGRAIADGFPAISSGQLPLWGFQTGGQTALPEAFAILGFAFYMQPMLMPLVAEMPPGPGGVWVSETAVHIVLFGVACGTYGSVGVFGAATFGDSTESNIMVNDLLPGRPTATLVLYGCLLVYLCCGMVTTHYALRASLEVLLTGAMNQLPSSRRAVLTTCILLAALAVACSFPTYAERIFALTGCTAVCLVCYCIPVYIHLKLHARVMSQAGKAAGEAAGSPATPDGAEVAPPTFLSPRVSTSCELLLIPGMAPGDGMVIPDAATVHSPHAHWFRSSWDALKRDNSSNSAAGALSELQAPLLQPTPPGTPGNGGPAEAAAVPEHVVIGLPKWRAWLELLALPVLIIFVGVGCSVAGLWVGAMDVYHAWTRS